jgi:hypothetical protein
MKLLTALLLSTAGTVVMSGGTFSVVKTSEQPKEPPSTTSVVQVQHSTNLTASQAPEILEAPEPPSPAVREIPLPTEEFWDKMAWCETHQNWQDGGQWAGGLGIYTKSEFPKSDMGTWERFGGEEFAPSPDKATREQQITIANRIAVLGWSKEMTRTPEEAERMGVPINWTWNRPAVGFKGWGALHCATKSPIKSPKDPPLFYYEDLDVVLAMTFTMGQTGIEVHDLQGIVGAKQDGKYGPITRKLHFAYLEKNSLNTSLALQNPVKSASASSGTVSSQSVLSQGVSLRSESKVTGRCPKWEKKLRQYKLPVKEFSFIMWRESKCIRQAIGWNYHKGKSHRDCKLSHARTYRNCKAVRSYDVGLLQINSSWKTLTAKVCKTKWGEMLALQDATCNLKVAAYLYKNGGLHHWRGTSGSRSVR